MLVKKKKKWKEKKVLYQGLKIFSVVIFQLSWILFLPNSLFKEKNIYI